jgi:hypothetical protein
MEFWFENKPSSTLAQNVAQPIFAILIRNILSVEKEKPKHLFYGCDFQRMLKENNHQKLSQSCHPNQCVHFLANKRANNLAVVK